MPLPYLKSSSGLILKEISPGRTDWKDWCWSWNSNTWANWCEELTRLKRPWCWERLRAGGEGDNRGWDGWMASPTQWTWVWVNARSWWWTGRPGVLWFMQLQRVGHDWVTELNWSGLFLLFSHWSHGPHHARFPCPSLSPRVCSNSCPLSQWCHPTISSPVAPFSSWLQSFPASGSFLMSQLFTSCGQSIGASASASVLPMNFQDWFPLGFTGLISLLSKGLSRVFSRTTSSKVSVFQHSAFLMVIAKCLHWPSRPHVR